MNTTENGNKPVIALTFDDGPNTGTTVEVLDKIEKYKVKATFFVEGQNINDATAKIARRAVQMGCELQNHSYTHGNMSVMTPEEIMEEISETSGKILEITGKDPEFFRPPYYAYGQTMLDMISMPFILGYGAEDWEDSVSADERAKRILSQAKDGAIFLLHDMENNDQTVEALDTIIPQLLSEGYEFLTVSELFRVKKVDVAGAAGNVFYSVE